MVTKSLLLCLISFCLQKIIKSFHFSYSNVYHADNDNDNDNNDIVTCIAQLKLLAVLNILYKSYHLTWQHCCCHPATIMNCITEVV